MSNSTRCLGLDVHAETISAAIAEGRGQIRSLGEFPNRPDAVRKLIEKLGGAKHLKVCYEAGPTGYALYWQLARPGVDREVIAPSLIPKTASDKVKTDRRDAEKLARSYQSGDLTPVWVPTPEHEALRDLVRQRAAAKADESRAKHRLVKHLLRRGLRAPDESGAWTHPWWQWVQSLKFDHEAQQVAFADCVAEVLHMGDRLARLDKDIDRLVLSAPPHMRAVIEALQALRGVAKLTAVTIMTEVGTFKRFRRPTEMMGYTRSRSGGEESSGEWSRLSGPTCGVHPEADLAPLCPWECGRDRLSNLRLRSTRRLSRPPAAHLDPVARLFPRPAQTPLPLRAREACRGRNCPGSVQLADVGWVLAAFVSRIPSARIRFVSEIGPRARVGAMPSSSSNVQPVQA